METTTQRDSAVWTPAPPNLKPTQVTKLQTWLTQTQVSCPAGARYVGRIQEIARISLLAYQSGEYYHQTVREALQQQLQKKLRSSQKALLRSKYKSVCWYGELRKKLSKTAGIS